MSTKIKSAFTTLASVLTEAGLLADDPIVVVPNPTPIVVPVPVPTAPLEELLFTCHMGVSMLPFVEVTLPSWMPKDGQHAAFDQKTKWRAELWKADVKRCKFEIIGGRLVTTVADGPVWVPGGDANINYGAGVIYPKFPAGPVTLTDDEELVCKFRAQAGGLTDRRWFDILVYDGTKNLVHPNGIMDFPNRHPTGIGGGQVWRWTITGNAHSSNVTIPNSQGYSLIQSEVIIPSNTGDNWNWDYPNVGRTPGDTLASNNLNGTQEAMDDLHDFTFRLRRTGCYLEENGFVIKESVFAKPLEMKTIQIAFVHMAYHLKLDLDNDLRGKYRQFTRLLKGGIPTADTRMWDDFDIWRKKIIR